MYFKKTRFFLFLFLLTNLFAQEVLKKDSIKVCYSDGVVPLMFMKDSKPVGISKDFMDLISDNMKIPFEYVIAKSYSEHLTMTKDNLCDVVPMIMRNPNRFNFLTPTDPYVFGHIALATKLHEAYVNDLNTLVNRKIGIMKQLRNVRSSLEQKYPNIIFIEIENDGLEKVKNEEIFGYIGIDFTISNEIKNYYAKELKIMKVITNRKIEGSVGISKKASYLVPLFNDAIKNITIQQRYKINADWKNIYIEKEIDYRYMWYVLGISLFIFLIIAIAYFKQNKLKRLIEIEKEKFENIFYSANDGILIYSNDRIVDHNKSIIDILGYEKEEIFKLNLSDLFPEYQKDNKHTQKELGLILHKVLQEGYYNFEWSYLKKDKTISWADIMITNISTYSNEVFHIVLRDISEKKKLEEELLAMNENLQEKVKEELAKNEEQQLMVIRQNRLAQMGEMISMIAHQWRQPLNNLSIINNIVVLKYSKNKLDEKVIDNFKTNSSKQIQQMTKTIDDFRDFFKPDKQKTVFNLNRVIDSTIDILKPMLEKNTIKYSFDFEKEVDIEGYSNELAQAIFNIINNSIDALSEMEDIQKNISIKIYEDDSNICLSIEDNAGGIPEDIISNIFDPYFSTKTEKNGTGLGLYMTRMIIEEHMNGIISVSNKDDGALFIIKFPKSI